MAQSWTCPGRTTQVFGEFAFDPDDSAGFEGYRYVEMRRRAAKAGGKLSFEVEGLDIISIYS